MDDAFEDRLPGPHRIECARRRHVRRAGEVCGWVPAGRVHDGDPFSLGGAGWRVRWAGEVWQRHEGVADGGELLRVPRRMTAGGRADRGLHPRGPDIIGRCRVGELVAEGGVERLVMLGEVAPHGVGGDVADVAAGLGTGQADRDDDDGNDSQGRAAEDGGDVQCGGLRHGPVLLPVRQTC